MEMGANAHREKLVGEKVREMERKGASELGKIRGNWKWKCDMGNKG